MTNAVVVGWLFIVIGALMFVSIGVLILFSRRSRGWPSVTGRVLSSEVARSRNVGGSYRLAVTYEYDVAGRRYEGTRVAFGDSLWGWLRSRGVVERLCAAHAPDEEIVVYYEARLPSLSTLNRKIDDMAYYALVTSLLLTTAGIGALQGWIPVVG
jgi:hypothetical protein